ncbi:MAG TPA: hypothetical protein VMF87_01230 [Streptosporangiaceae bacterium]|nr:hypothetical protein [Streptosporangiaceae bacterium]
MNDNIEASRGAWRGRTAAMALLAGAALFAPACSGGSHSSGPGTTSAQQTAQKMAVFARCMRGHGEPDFYYANPHSVSNSSVAAFSLGQGYVVTGVKPQSSQFQSALASCKHLLPPVPTRVLTRQQLQRDVRFAQCMRSHGYPAYPDPDVRNGELIQQPLPASIDTSSPQFQAAEKSCGAGT